MSSIAFVTDSNSGISKDLAEKLGIKVVPMPFMIQGETYYENITLSKEAFYKKLTDGEHIVTSQPTPEAVMNIWEELLREHDEVVHIPMSSGISGSCATATALAQDYEDKIHVVNNQRISITQLQSVLDAIALGKIGMNGAKIKQILEQDKFNSTIYITLDTLHYLKKGGRITPAAAALGTVLRLKPVLQIQGEKLDAFAKARTLTQAKTIMINAIKSDMINRFGLKVEDQKLKLFIAHTNNEDVAKVLQKELLTIFQGYDIAIADLSLSIACHIGPGALAIACTKNLEIV